MARTDPRKRDDGRGITGPEWEQRMQRLMPPYVECPYCGKENLKKARFCSFCGKEIPAPEKKEVD